MQNGGQKYNMGFLWLICIVAAMGGLLFGYDWVVVGGAKAFYEPHFNITKDMDLMRGWAMSSALFGCIIGAVLSGVLTDRFGRKRLLILSGLLFTVSAVTTALSWDFTSYNVARIIGGLGIGLASNLSPMFIAEISPAKMRGKFVSINQLTIVIGILAAQIVNMMIARPVPEDATMEIIRDSWNGQTGWRWMFGAETVPAFLFFLLMFFVPESPRWLVKYGKNEQAEAILTRIGGSEYGKTELANIQQTISNEEVARVNYKDLLEPKLLMILTLGVFLAVFQQWCGINVIFNYAQEVFAAAGYGVSAMMFNIVITGIVSLFFTFAAIYTVDKLGRRPLMLFGAAGLAGIYIILGICYKLESTGIHMLILVVLAIGCYSMTLAPITWVVISEIFPNRIRGAAMSVAVFSLWIACTVLTLTFPYLEAKLGIHGTFWIFSFISIMGLIVIWKKLPETKGKSLEQIENELVD
ncbi:MAG: sugar porter family MFS transporter [Planctomycetes bacterium]|nr:sugar porter family MFS transporter [Planctomycetota bacterium]